MNSLLSEPVFKLVTERNGMEAPMENQNPLEYHRPRELYKKPGLFILKESWLSAIIGNDNKSNRGIVCFIGVLQKLYIIYGKSFESIE